MCINCLEYNYYVTKMYKEDNKMKIYGYMRVSTKEQNEKRQQLALFNYGVAKENIYLDKISGDTFERKEYKKMIKKLQAGDLLVISSIDRLGRNYDEIIKQWRMIIEDIEADIKVLDMPLLDTTVNNDELIGKFISDIVLQILSYVAQTERENIRKRQAEGISVAKAKGVKFGRPKKKRPKDFEMIKERWIKREITSRQAAQVLEIPRSTFVLWARQ